MQGKSLKEISMQEAADIIEAAKNPEVALDLGSVSFVVCKDEVMGDLIVVSTFSGRAAIIQ